MYMDEDGKKAIVGCREGTVNYIVFETMEKAKEKQQFKVDIGKIMFSRDTKKFALVDTQRDLISQFDRDHWLQFSQNDSHFEIKNPETGWVLTPAEKKKKTYCAIMGIPYRVFEYVEKAAETLSKIHE